ncbi:MAG: bifunctional riboflavin kinase/FMN adenylyltransferase, partial [Thermodesulfobacteriota bacterium]
ARFDMEFASQGAREFVEKVVHQLLGVREVLVGYDYAFGRGREGNTDFLHAMGRELGFRVEVVSPVMMDGEAVSSSRVRKAVQGGEVALANRMLGREFASEGVVQRGHGRGKGLGYPTANLSLETELTPKPGVYVVRVYLPGAPQPLGGMANLGTNPTFSDQRSSFEVHILDFQGELYGQRIRVGFVDRLRDERRFPSPRALVEQLHLDEEASRSILCGKQ